MRNYKRKSGRVYHDENGEIHEDADATAAADRSKGSFKIDLMETVHADPKLKPRHGALMCAYLSVMEWPKRRAWLCGSLARAKTGLAASQISPARKALIKRGYLTPAGRMRNAQAFTISNPRRDEVRQHVAIMAEHYREQDTERQAARRAHINSVTPKYGATESPLSHHDIGVTSHPIEVASTPHSTPHSLAMKEGTPFRGFSYATASGDDPNRPFPVPDTEQELESMLAALVDGVNFSPAIVSYFRKRLLAGELTPAEVEDGRRAMS